MHNITPWPAFHAVNLLKRKFSQIVIFVHYLNFSEWWPHIKHYYVKLLCLNQESLCKDLP